MNALVSIRMGLEDYSSESKERNLSAARNLLAGALLLAKSRLVYDFPALDPRWVLNENFDPEKNKNQNLTKSKKTITAYQLKRRFKESGYHWPKEIDKLREARNDLEHFYLSESEKVLPGIIKSNFSAFIQLFLMLDKDPVIELRKVFSTLSVIKLDLEETMANALESLQIDEHTWIKKGGELLTMACPECGEEAYYRNSNISRCLKCTFTIEGVECLVCETAIELEEYCQDHPELCSAHAKVVDDSIGS